MKMIKGIIAAIFITMGIVIICQDNSPIVGNYTKQTLYLWLMNCFHIQDDKAKVRFLLIDDDGGNGVFTIKKICDELNIKATFAINPGLLENDIIDSLRAWQKQGFYLAIHGYYHNNWRSWKYEEIIDDIEKSEKWFSTNGLYNKSRYIVTPRGSNTYAIRKAIKDKGYMMITGANIMNPDTTLFQYGRIIITKDTDVKKIENLLVKAKLNKLYAIFGTHSSNTNEFSEDKTRELLQKSIALNFNY